MQLCQQDFILIPMAAFRKLTSLLLICIVIIGAVCRFYRLNNPVADWHSWRQADTSAVSRNFLRNGFDLLHPTYDDISNIQTGKDNPNGYRYVEFPLYNFFQAGLYKAFGLFTLEEWGRVVSIIFSLEASLFLYLLIRRRSDGFSAFAVTFFYIFLPYNIYYSRTILPDTAMVASALGGIYFFNRWVESKNKNIILLILSVIFMASSLLFKPYAVFYFLPIIVLVFIEFKWSAFKIWELYLFAFFTLMPLIWWRKYMLSYPEGIPANSWLFNGNGIRFRPAFFRWIFYERIIKLICGYLGSIFFIAGFPQIWKDRNNMLFFLSFPISALLYVIIFATGNVQHDYYQIVIMPAVALLMGFGSVWIFNFLRQYANRFISFFVLALIIIISFWFSWAQVKDYFNVNNWSIVRAGEAIDRLTPKNALIVAPYNGDTSLLYQAKRKGWPAFEHSLPELIKMGASYLVLVNPSQKDLGLGKTYKIISSTKDYILFDLNKK